ncbi:MAG: FapA family protein [Lachnospiraceae bacterium]|nr:FapA family protein [Lachnospiraceae bacterium]MDE6184292.1 FapA family protein [Lachnospiraceae bacterium]
MKKNGYFQVVCGRNETSLKVFQPRNGGKEVNVKEVINYLNRNEIAFEAHTLNKGFKEAFASDKEVYQFVINQNASPEVKGSYIFQVSQDKMMAMARFYPPSEKGERLTAQEFIDFLMRKNIKFGIRKEGLQNFFSRPVYCTDILVAKGQPPRHGTDARIEYYFETDLHAKPTLKEDGSVDFFHLNALNHCKKGDVLARLFPGDAGEYGIDIYNDKIKPRTIKQAVLKYGRNITISDDRQVLTTQVNGHVSLVEGKVFVSDVLEVENVDNSTGNIEYDGNVMVNGNVCTNFRVKAKGDIEVRGVVEGAFLEAQGSVVIARGMNGMAKGTLKAGGNVIAKFIENAKVNAGGYVSAGSILHSEVTAGTEITVSGKRGFITGGKVCAANLIQVKTLGSYMGADTLVEVGVDPNIKQRIQEIQKEMAENKKEMDALAPVLLGMAQKMTKGANLKQEQLKSAQRMMQKDKHMKKQQEEYMNEIDTLQKLLAESGSAKIEVSGEVFSGTRICIGDASMVVKNSMSHCKFIKSKGEVEMTVL